MSDAEEAQTSVTPEGITQACNGIVSRFRQGQITKDAVLASISATLESTGNSGTLNDYWDILDSEEATTTEAGNHGRSHACFASDQSQSPSIDHQWNSTGSDHPRAPDPHGGLKRSRTHSGISRKRGRTLLEWIERRREHSPSGSSRGSRSLSPQGDDSTEYAWCSGYMPWEPEDNLFVQDLLLRKTHHLCMVYGQDPKRAVRSLQGCYNKPPFPSSLWKDILLGNYIDFGKVRATMIGLGGARRIKSLGDDVELAFGGAEPSAAIGNGHQWASCYG